VVLGVGDHIFGLLPGGGHGEPIKFQAFVDLQKFQFFRSFVEFFEVEIPNLQYIFEAEMESRNQYLEGSLFQSMSQFRLHLSQKKKKEIGFVFVFVINCDHLQHLLHQHQQKKLDLMQRIEGVHLSKEQGCFAK